MNHKKTSIIILTYNKLEYTQACIESIRKYTPRGTYQLIVVDNLSTDGTRDWLAEQTDILTIFNEENVGFPKGCNQGMELSTGDSILLLNNDVVVTENWLKLMNDCLYSSDEIGAVGPVTNSAYGDQEIAVSYSTLDEMWDFANTYNLTAEPDWERRLKLIGFCMLIKKEAVDQVGLLDEAFTPGMCEDSDYSFRLLKSGFELILCRNVFIHHFGSTSFGEMPEQRQRLWNRNREKFEEKWGFHTSYHAQPREDLVQLMNEQDRYKKMNILDIGCACGATLLNVKYKYPNAELFGIEKNEHAASIAGLIGNVTIGDGETISYEAEAYDYIILGDILQQMKDPWKFLARVKESLKPNGTILASIPNATHYSVIFSLMKSKSLYGKNEMLDHDTLRLFSLSEVQRLFVQSGFDEIGYKMINNEVSTLEQRFIDQLSSLVGSNDNTHLTAVKYLIRATRSKNSYSSLEILLEQINRGIDVNETVLEMTSMLKDGSINSSMIISTVNTLEIDRQLVLNILANQFFIHGLYNDIIPLLNASLEINSKHYDTLYNYASLLHSIGADREALMYLNQIEEKDHESGHLLEKVLNNLI
ncbi:glycosyltransferase [Paenibacillus dokdonensis]|uniref:glycosyltransferase n=1 Tax=Paenibacillus dokdonensis TaxID=2567944 RepID=UPI0010A90638|nr:glycosyltransferase [Paenibacillus dokdonensis]